jgi:hypothetical protein
MLNINVSPFGLATVGLNAYADPTLIDVMGRPEIVGLEPGTSVAGFAVSVNGGMGSVTCAAGVVFADP